MDDEGHGERVTGQGVEDGQWRQKLAAVLKEWERGGRVRPGWSVVWDGGDGAYRVNFRMLSRAGDHRYSFTEAEFCQYVLGVADYSPDRAGKAALAVADGSRRTADEPPAPQARRVRVMPPETADVTPEQADSIAAALMEGKTLERHKRKDNGRTKAEITKTRFVDPDTETTRWAVLVWDSGAGEWMSDFPNEHDADTCLWQARERHAV